MSEKLGMKVWLKNRHAIFGSDSTLHLKKPPIPNGALIRGNVVEGRFLTAEELEQFARRGAF